MRLSLLLQFLEAALSASSPTKKREVCTVKSFGDPLSDDVPAIVEALKRCGDSGRILLPADQTFRIRSPLDLSPCQACDFQINGFLSIAPDWDYWEKQSAVFKISKTTAAVIH